MTITEALAEIKTIQKRIDSKQQFIGPLVLQHAQLKDPMTKEGGSREVIARERQAIRDLEERIVKIRTAIQAANTATTVTISGVARSVTEWLVWRREVAPKAQAFLRSIRDTIARVRAEQLKKGAQVGENAAGPTDVAVHLDEQALALSIEGMEQTLGELDGMLSLKNATVQVEL